MPFRFRKSLKLFPGIRLNLSKSGASVSLGGKGLTYNIGQKGNRATVGLPGSGMSYSEYTPHEKDPNAPVEAPRPKPFLGVMPIMWIVIGVALGAYLYKVFAQ